MPASTPIAAGAVPQFGRDDVRRQSEWCDYQKDLGAQTADQAKGITAINPDKTSRPVTPETDEEAESQ